MTKKLFLSFSTLLTLLSEQKVSADELKNGIFMFGCTRDHAFNPGSKGETDERTWNRGRNAVVHPVLVNALLTAELEDRADWRRSASGAQQDPIEVLNRLLERNGITTLTWPADRQFDSSCTYPAIKDLVEAAALPLEVIY